MRKSSGGKRILSCAVVVCILLSAMAGMFAAPVYAADAPHDTQAELDAQWAELQGIIGQYNGEWGTNTPKIPEGSWKAAYVEETNAGIPKTALLGNGDLGASAGGVYGGANNYKTVRLGKSDFWTTDGAQGSYPLTVGGVTIEGAGEIAQDPNMANGKSVIVNSVHPDNNYGNVGANITDGNDSSKWVGNNADRVDVSGLSGDYEKGGQYAVIDLGAEKQIGRYVIKNAGFANENNHNMKAWKLQRLPSGTEPSQWTKEAIRALDSSWVDIDTVTDNPNNDGGKTYDKTLDAPVTARYVRLLVLIPSNELGNGDARVHEVELYAPEEGGPGGGIPNVNIAPTGMGSASSVNGGSNDNFGPQRALTDAVFPGDGSNGYEGWVSEAGANQWFQVAFPGEVQIGRFRMVHDGGSRSGENNNNAKAFKVEVSSDEASWTEIYTVSDNSGGVTDVDLASTVNAKFFKITYTQTVQSGDERGRLAHLEIYPWAHDYGVEEPNVNIATSANVAAATASSTHESFAPDKSINGTDLDGNGGPLTQPDIYYEGWTSRTHSDDTDIWFKLEFNEARQIGRFRMVHDGGSRGNKPGENNDNNNPKAFKVEVSDDDLNWTEIYSVADNAGDSTGRVTDIDLGSPVTAKFFRISYILPTQEDPIENDSRARLPQLEIYPWAHDYVPSGGGAGPADPPPQPAKPEFYEKQDILNARVETTTTIGGIPLQITTWTPANANYVIQKVEVRDEYAEPTGRLRAFGFTPTGVRGGTITVDKGVDDAIDTAWVSRKTASPNGSYDTDIGWRSEVVLNTKVIGGTDTAVGVMDHSDARSFVEFTITKGTPAYVVTAVGGAGRTYVHGGTGYDQLNPARNGETPVQESARMLAAVTSEANITTMLEDHAAWWKNYWMQSYVKVNGGGPLASVEKYYYAAQYLLGASTREGKQPAGLFAHWHTTDSSTWNGDYHLNYNFISTWYGSASSNREEQLLPAVMALNDYISVARENAASTARNGTRGIENITNGNDPNRPAYSPNEDTPYIQYRLEKDAAEGVTTIHPQNGIAGGLLFPVGVGPWGSAPDTGFHGEAVNGPFSAWPMIEYYNYTLDTDFLADKAFDMVKGTATFGVGWMENYATDADGQELYRLISGYNEGSWSLNPAVELGAYKMVLEYAAKYGRILDAAGKLNPADRAMIEVWENVRAGMAAQPTAMSQGNDLTTMALCYALAQEEYKDGVWAEMASPLPSDGNIIPLESIIPSGQIGYFSPEEELQTARNTILRFGGNAWSTMNNFPKGFPVAARVKFNPDSLMTALADRINKQIQAANLRISDDAHGIEKTGAIEAINSMLIIGDKDVVKVFPNWYTGGTNFVNPGVAKKDAEFHRLRAPGAFTVSAKYEAGAFSGGGGVTSLKVTSEAGARLTIASPWGRNIVVKGSDSGNVPFDFGTAPNHPEEVTVSFDTAKGETYTFEPDGGTYSQPVNANVTFAVEPQNAVVTITGKNGVPISPVQAANGDVKTLDNGLYSYTATADGYNDKLGYFVVSGVDMTAEIAMQATASAVFDITPQTARVTVQKDGVTVGTVNGNGSLPLADGVYTYTASAPGFNQKEGKFRIDEGRDTLVQDSLVGFAKASFAVTFSPAADPAPQAAIVVWNSLDEVCEPQEAGVYMLPDGAYRYRVAAGGYATVNGTFTVDKAAADEQTVNVLLSAGEVDISFDIAPQAASDAAMKLYDAVTGDEIAPKTGRTYTLTAGKTYAYTAVKTDYLDESGMLTAEGPGSVTITMRAKATELPIEGDDMEGDTRHTTDPGFNFDGNHINNIRSDDWICYKNRFILGGITDFEIEYATMADTLGAVKVYLAPVGSQDISDGTLIISLTGLPSTGGWGAPYRTGSVLGQGQTIEPHEGGFYDIYIKFGGDGNPHAMRFTLDPNITSTYDVTFNVWPASASFALTKAGESTVVDPVPPGGQAYSLAEGLYHYKAEMPGYGTEEAVVLVKKDQTIDIRLLPPAVDISGFTAKTGLTYNGDPQGDVYTGTAVFTKDGAPVTIASPVFTDHYTSVAGYDSPTPPINAGSYTLTRTLVHDDYSGTVEIPFIIEKKPVDVQANAGYVVSKPYDGTTSAGAAAGGLTATGVLAKDSAVEAAVSFVGEYPEANAGAYAVDLHIALIGTGNSNYRLVSNTVPVSGAQITKIPPTAVHFTVPAVMEDGTEQVGYRLKPQYDGLGAPKNVTYTGTNGTTYGPSETPPTGEGYYSITAEFEDGANFNATSAPLDLGTLHIEAPALLLGGDGVVTVAPDSITHNEMTLNWTKATGRLSGQDEIRYYVYLVNDAPVALADMPDSNDTLLNAGGTLDIDSHFATNLQPQTAHTFIVVAEDTAGNRRAYNPVSETTLEAPAGALTGTAVIDNMNPSVGSVLTAALLDGNSAALSYTWISGGEALGSGETYTVKESDIGKAIQVVITAEDKTGAVTSLQTAPVVETFIAATGIALNKNAIDMRIGDREQLIAAVLPEDATNKAVIWTSSNPAVAAVDVFGMVTAAGYGEAVITAASAENAALTATCAIRVPTPPAPQTPQQPQMPAQGRGSWTGDDSNLALWIVLLCGVSVVLVGVIYRRRKGAGDKARSE